MDMITNEHYYRSLNIMDRIEEVRLKKHISRVEFGDRLGKSKAYYQAFYDACRGLRIESVINFAKILDVSVDYLLSGKKEEPYRDFKLDFSKITTSKVRKLPNTLKVIKCNLKKNKIKSMTVKTLFEFEHYLSISAIELIGG